MKKPILASSWGYDKVVELLIKAGVDPSIKDDKELTALQKGLYCFKFEY
jgi:hypothetical protein